MDDRFYHSFLPPVAKICGRKLETFSLWHHLILNAVGSPIAEFQGRIAVSDLLVAVRVCGLKYGQTSIKPGFRDIFWKWKLTRNPRRFRKELEGLTQWMARQSSPPRFRRQSAGDGIHKSIESGPRCLGLACSLMARGGISEADAWNTSLGRAMWLDAQFAQLEGIQLQFLDDEDLDDAPIDLSGLTDSEALAMFRRDLPEDRAQRAFAHWQTTIKKKELEPC